MNLRTTKKIWLAVFLLTAVIAEAGSQTRSTRGTEELSKMEKELRQMQKQYQAPGSTTPEKRQTYNPVITDNTTSLSHGYTSSDPSLNRKNWTLEECIQHALEHNLEIRQLKVQRGAASLQESTARNSRLPDLTVGGSQEWTFGRSQVYTDLNETNSRTVLGLTSTIPIFTGFRIPNEIARAKLEFEAATQNLEKAKDNLSLNITSLFLQVLFNKELVKINEEQLELTKTQVKKTQIMIQGGMVPPSHLYDIQAQQSKDRVALIEARNNLDLSLLDLSQALELEHESTFDITAPWFDESSMTAFHNSLQPAGLIYENAVSFKPVVLEQELRVKSAEKSLKIARADYLPSLNFTFQFGSGYFYRYNAQDIVDPATSQVISPANRPFSKQLGENDYTMAVFKLSIPVFNRFETRNKVRRAKLDILNQELILQNTKKMLYKEIQTAYKNAAASYEKYLASIDAVESTGESFKHAQIRYDAAKMSPFEYDEAKTRYLQSQAEQIQAKYDYILRTKILDFYYGIPIRL